MERQQSDFAQIAASLDLTRSDAWVGIRTALMELERKHPGSITRLNAELELKRLGVRQSQ